jgi:predicted DNA binding CopG/RHH family protein
MLHVFEGMNEVPHVNESENVITTVRLPSPLLEALRERARAEGETLSVVVRQLLRRGLAYRERSKQ